jgi:hypothetical protein
MNMVAGVWMRPPYLTGPEVHDLHRALCMLGTKMQAPDELEQAREWMIALLDDARPLTGHTMTDPIDRHEAMVVLKAAGRFTHLDAREILARPDDPWPRRPVCLADRITGDMWLRLGEAATYVRQILDVRIRAAVLTRRWVEIGIAREYVDNRRKVPRLKGQFYRVPSGWIAE